MGFTLIEDHFSTEAEALAEIAERGWHAVTVDIAAVDNDLHWHDFDSVNFILRVRTGSSSRTGRFSSAGRGRRSKHPAGSCTASAVRPTDRSSVSVWRRRI